MKQKLLIVSPCRNEAKYMEKTIQSVLKQTLKPDTWIIVNDGSTDATASTLEKYTKNYACIRVIHRQDRGARSVGPGVIDTFYEGLNTVDLEDYDYLCKLDLDLELPNRYFDILIDRMEKNPRIGTCSGKPYFIDSKGMLKSEKCGDEMSVGMTKLYRTKCFQSIGGFVREVMWDGIDCHKCRMLGWLACSWDEPELRFTHLRPMGSSQHGILKGRMRHGFGQYFMGTSLPYMTASAIFRMTSPPYVIGGISMLIGYLKALITRSPRYEDPQFRHFLHHYQWLCLLKGKKKATKRVNADRFQLWEDR